VKPLVVALAGTDHHPFDRMVEWVDAAAGRRPGVRFLVQHGPSTSAPRLAEGAPFLTRDRLVALLAEAAVVICHGGPGTITDAREAGHVPLCLPRDPELGEHVDGHQQRFADLVAGVGVVRLVTSWESFEAELDRALARMSPLGATTVGATTVTSEARDTARARLATQLDDLLTARPRRLPRRQRAAN
jgi:UDP-N-acetylglucosamine transferase subunit ALG13